MARAFIDRKKCKGCLICVSACPRGIIVVDNKLNSKGIRTVKIKEINTCLGCALCARICPDCAIEVWK